MVTDDSTDTCIDVVMLTGLSLSKLHDITRFVGTRLTATSSINCTSTSVLGSVACGTEAVKRLKVSLSFVR